DANAHFHVVGDHPGVHGGSDSGIPFTDCAAGVRLQRALVAAGLLEQTGTPPTVDRTFLSYLYMCVPTDTPSESEYATLEPFFDAELRAITAHVLLPVGERATRHVLATYSAQTPSIDMAALHATEIGGSGFLIYPIEEPSDWSDGDERDLVQALRDLQQNDYRREVDLGRFVADDEPYFVR
ncbi:MAG: uracil-DNA glycosylase family protein, partial [Halorientalis sp.]